MPLPEFNSEPPDSPENIQNREIEMSNINRRLITNLFDVVKRGIGKTEYLYLQPQDVILDQQEITLENVLSKKKANHSSVADDYEHQQILERELVRLGVKDASEAQMQEILDPETGNAKYLFKNHLARLPSNIQGFEITYILTEMHVINDDGSRTLELHAKHGEARPAKTPQPGD